MALLTIEMLKKHTEGTVTLPAVSAAAGEDVTLRYRWLGREEYLTLSPPAPPGAENWNKEEVAERAEAWFNALPPDIQERRRQQARDLLYAVVALAALDPKLTLDQARQLGGDAEIAAVEILRASGILRPAQVVDAPPPSVNGDAPAAALPELVAA